MQEMIFGCSCCSVQTQSALDNNAQGEYLTSIGLDTGLTMYKVSQFL